MEDKIQGWGVKCVKTSCMFRCLVESGITWISSGLIKARYLVPFVDVYPYEQKGWLYLALAHSIFLYRSETEPVIQDNVVRLERSDARSIRWICNPIPEKWISGKDLRTGLKLNSMRGCLQDRRLNGLAI